MRKSLRTVLSAVAAGAVLIGTSSPAAATIKYCDQSGGEAECQIAYQEYKSGGVRRSSVDGSFVARPSVISSSYDEIDGKIRVRDLSEDGYRARVWVHAYSGCWCIDEDHRIYSQVYDAHDATTGPQYLAWRMFKSDLYVVQVIVGRYKGATGACEPKNQYPRNTSRCGDYHSSEQRFYFTVG